MVNPTPSQFLHQPPYYQSPGPDFSDAGDSLERDTAFNPFATVDHATSISPSMLQRNGYPNTYAAVTMQGMNQVREDFKSKKLNLLKKSRQELRNLSVSPKLIQEHVFNTFQTKLKGYEQHDVTLSTKARSVHSVAAMIEQHI